MITVQLPYSLITRGIEAEFVPMAQTLGLGLTAWSPVGGGLLTGKYRRAADGVAGAAGWQPRRAGTPGHRARLGGNRGARERWPPTWGARWPR